MFYTKQKAIKLGSETVLDAVVDNQLLIPFRVFIVFRLLTIFEPFRSVFRVLLFPTTRDPHILLSIIYITISVFLIKAETLLECKNTFAFEVKRQNDARFDLEV